MLLISEGPKPVDVRLCLGLVMPSGPTGPLRSEIGAEVEGFRSLVVVDVAMAEDTVWLSVRKKERRVKKSIEA